MKINTIINFFLVNYPSIVGSIPEGGRKIRRQTKVDYVKLINLLLRILWAAKIMNPRANQSRVLTQDSGTRAGHFV